MIKELLEYQNVDAGLRKIEIELSGSEERKKAISAKKYLDGVEENVNKLDSRSADLMAQYDISKKEIEALKEQQEEFLKASDDAVDEVGINYLLKKIDEVVAKIKSLSNTISKIDEEIKSIIKEYSTIKATTRAAQVQYADNAKKYGELKLSFQGEREKIEKELEELKKKVDPDLMERYLKKRANKIYPVLFEVKNNVCGACNMQLSMSELGRLKNGEIIECDQCGRLLYKSSEK